MAYNHLSSVIIRRRPHGPVPADTAHLSHELYLGGDFIGLFDSYSSAANAAQLLTLSKEF